jgi:hypothetical protein
MKIITWNTGRLYSDKGQRIAATQLNDGRVMFVDIDRGLEYVTAKPCELGQSAVMACYDYNQTDYHRDEERLALLKDAARAI